MPLILWFLVVLGTLAGLMSVLVCYAACYVGGVADEQSETMNDARPGGHTSVAAAHPVRGNAGRADTPLRSLK